MNSFERVRTFLERTPIGPASLGELLKTAEDLWHANGVELVEFNRSHQLINSVMYGPPGAQVQDYLQHYQFINDRLLKVKLHDQIVSDETYLDLATFHKGEFYDWTIREVSCSDVLGIHLRDTGAGRAGLAFYHDGSSGIYTEADRRAAAALLPMIETNVRLSRLVPHDMPFLDDLLQHTAGDRAFMILTDTGRVMARSAAADRLLDQPTGLRLHAGELRFSREDSRLSKALADTLNTGVPRDLSFEIPDGLLALSICALTVSTYRFARPLLLIELSVQPAAKPSGRLTPSEHLLLDAILAGKTLRDFAAETGKSYNTCRNQLASLHSKLGTRRITDLIRAAVQRDMS